MADFFDPVGTILAFCPFFYLSLPIIFYLDAHFFQIVACRILQRADTGVKNVWNKTLGATLTARMRIDDIVAKMSAVLPNFKSVAGDPLAIPGRFLVKDGLVTRWLPYENRKKEAYIALFNDYLCICKPKYGGSGTIVCRNAISLSSAVILEGPNNEKKSAYFFRIHHIAKAKTYDFMVHTLVEKDEWLDALEELVNSQKCTGTQVTPTGIIEEFSLKNMNRLAKRSNRVFGVGLADAVHKQSFKSHSELQLDPYIVAQGFEYLRQDSALSLRGIFQLGCTDRLEVRNLRSQWNAGLEPIFDGQSFELVADLLVLYFKQLPLSVIPKEFTEVLIRFFDMKDRNKRLENICVLLNACPPSNFAVLVDVLVYLGYAAEQSHLNGLTAERAGLVFSRLLMHFEPKQYRKCSGIISLLVENVDKLMETHVTISTGGGPGAVKLSGESPTTSRTSSSANLTPGMTPSHSMTHLSVPTYSGSFRPVPKFLFDINRERQLTCINKCKYRTLDVIKALSSRVAERGSSSSASSTYESALQSMLITLNTLVDYEPTFVKYFMDLTNLNMFYLRLNDLNRLLNEAKTKSKTTKSTKLFASTRDALEAERLRTTLWDFLEGALDYLDRACSWTRDVRVAYFKIRKELERAQELKQALGIPRDTELDSTMAALQPIYADAAVRDFWDHNFGLEKFIVKVDLFIDALLRINDSSLSDTERQVVRHILDHHQTGRVNIYGFAIFVSGYGPIESCLANVIKMSSEKWFFGFASYPESVRLLEANPPGSFLVRFSQTNPGNFSVDYLSPVSSTPVSPSTNSGPNAAASALRTIALHSGRAHTSSSGSSSGNNPSSQRQPSELRTIKIHNTSGGFEVVRADLSFSSAASSETTSAVSSAPTSAPPSAPSSAPNSGKVDDAASNASGGPKSMPTSTKLVAAQGSFRMRTMTLLQAPGRRNSGGTPPPNGVLSSIPLHLQPKQYSASGPSSPLQSPPGSLGAPNPSATPPGSYVGMNGSTSPPPGSHNSNGSGTGSLVLKASTATDLTHLPALRFATIDGVLENLKELLVRPVQPNYFLINYFHGCIDKNTAIRKLNDCEPGTFLVRFGDEEETIAVHVVSTSPLPPTPNSPVPSSPLSGAGSTGSAPSSPKISPKSSPRHKVETIVLERVFGSAQLKHLGVTYKDLHDFVARYNGTTLMKTPLSLVTAKPEDDSDLTIEDGTLEKIVEKLYNGTDLGDVQVFLLTYRAFATPVAVLNILRERIHYHREHNQDRVFRLRMGNFVKSWLTEYSWDIKDDKDFFKLGLKLAYDLAADPSTSAIGQQLIILIQKVQDASEASLSPLSPNGALTSTLKPVRADRCVAVLPPRENLSSSVSSDMSSNIHDDDTGFSERYDDEEEGTGTGSPSSSGYGSPVGSPGPSHAVLRRVDSGNLSSRDSQSPRDSRDGNPHRPSFSASGSYPNLNVITNGFSISGATGAGSRHGTLRNSQEHGTPHVPAIRSVLEIPVSELAEQLTLIEFEVFTAIPLHEFLQQGWLKPDKELRSPNLLRMVRLSTRLSRWVVSEILADDKPAKRAKVIEYFVQLCHALLTLRNFNGIMAIIAALSGSAIGRLKKTWDAFSKAKKKELDELHSIMDTELNWTRYRQALLNAPPPKIPYLGLILTDLVFIEDGNKDRLPSGHINWVKCECLAASLHQVQLCQQSTYPITPNDTLVDSYVLEQAKTLTEREAYDRSLVVEPRSTKKKK